MRKRNIKSIAHWVIMSVLLLFPVLMVGVSAFANDEQTTTVNTTYEYETNELNSVNDVLPENIYKLNTEISQESFDDILFTCDLIINKNSNITIENLQNIDAGTDTNVFYYGASLEIQENTPHNMIGIYINDFLYAYFNCDYINFSDTYVSNLEITYFREGNLISSYFGISDYLGETTTIVDIQNSNYKQEVNNWANGFKNLPVNQWYGNLLDAIGVGATTNSVMNVIYVYPLYVLWVYILDLIVDCLLLIINFGHNALRRLGADNE